MKKLNSIPTLIAIFLISSLHTASANVVGTDAQNFNPTTNGLDFVTVQSSQTLGTGILNLGFFANYAKNTLPYFNDGHKNDSNLSADAHVGLGLTKNWEIGVSFPYLLHQSVNSTQNVGEYDKDGLTEIRLNTKYHLLGDETGGLAAIASIGFPQIDNDPFTGKSPGPTIDLELAADKVYSKSWAFGANAGYRIRHSGDAIANAPDIQPFKNQWIASVATSYYYSEPLRFIAEVFGSIPAEKSQLNPYRKESSLEWIAGAKYYLRPNLALHAGGGTQLLTGSATPEWRVYTGVNWTLGPLWGSEKSEPVADTYTPPAPVEDQPILTEVDDQETVTIDPTEYTTPTKEKETFVLHNIKFEVNSDRLDKTSLKALDKFAAFLKQPPTVKQLIISGHTDNTGSAKYNLALSKRRATTVSRYLVWKHGIPAAKIKALGFGLSKPVASNDTQAGRDKNRRVEFKVIRFKKK